MISSRPLSPNNLNQMKSSSPFCSLWRLRQPSLAMLASSWMLCPFHRAYIFGHHFLCTIQVDSTEPPPIPTFTPPLDILKAEESVQRDQEAIQGNSPQYKDAAQESKDEPKKKAATSSAISQTKKAGEPTASLGNKLRRVAATQKAPAQVGPSTYPKTGNASAALPAGKLSPSSPSKGKSGRGSKHQPKPSSTSPGQATSVAPSS